MSHLCITGDGGSLTEGDWGSGQWQDSAASHSGGHARSRNHRSQEVKGSHAHGSLLQATLSGKGRARLTSNSGPLAGPRLWSRLRASLGAGLGAGGAGAGGTAAAGPLQGALQDGLRSPEVRVAVRNAEHGDYTLENLPSTDTSPVQSHPQVQRSKESTCVTVHGTGQWNDSHVILCGAPSQNLLDEMNSRVTALKY